jgi:hypothetical protein
MRPCSGSNPARSCSTTPRPTTSSSTAASARSARSFAYVVPGVAGVTKVASICDLVERIGKHQHQNDLLAYAMHGLWSELIEFDGLGSFLAGQIVADLAHLGFGDGWLSDRATWAPLGPGSARGINRLRGIPKHNAVSQDEFNRLLPALIEDLRPRVEQLWSDRQLEAMDIQNCLCEFDKYRRLTLGEGKVRAGYNGRADQQASLL